jgi:hypothetical protein
LFSSNEALLHLPFRFTEHLIAFLGNKGREKYLGTQNLKTEYDVDMMRCSHKFCLLAVKFDKAFLWRTDAIFHFANLICQRIILMLGSLSNVRSSHSHFLRNLQMFSIKISSRKGQQTVAQNSIYPLSQNFFQYFPNPSDLFSSQLFTRKAFKSTGKAFSFIFHPNTSASTLSLR